MPPPGVNRDSTRFVSIFQKAHAHVAALQRLDDQIAALFDQRRKTIEDLRAVQTQINSEFERVLELDRVIPADTLSQAGDDDAEVLRPVIRDVKTTAAQRVAALEVAAS